MEARSASVSPAVARIFWTMALFARPYSSIFAAVAPARIFTAAYCCRRSGSARRVSRTAVALASALDELTYCDERGGEAEVEFDDLRVAVGGPPQLAVAIHPRMRALDDPAGASLDGGRHALTGDRALEAQLIE